MMRLSRPWTEPWKAQQKRSKRFPPAIQVRALVKMMMIDSAEVVSDLAAPPSNKLEKLIGAKTIIDHGRCDDDRYNPNTDNR
jgi:plasmid maintenance system killer protein